MKRKNPIQILFFVLLFLLPFAGKSQDTIRISDFGIRPDSRNNSVMAVKKALEACRTKTNPVLVFPKGRYDFWPQYCEERVFFESNTYVIPFRICPILIEDFDRITIECNGSDFIFHGRMQPFTIDSCKNVSISNVNIDWEIPMTAQAQVVAVTDQYIDLAINAYESPYVIEKNKLVFVGEGWKSPWYSSIEFEQHTKLIPQQTGDSPLGGGWNQYKAEEIKKGLVRLHHNFKRKPPVGNYLVLRHSSRDHSGVFINESKNIRIDNMNMYQNCGLGILAQYSEDLTFNTVNFVPNEAKNRILSGHDDGFHFSNCRGLISLDDCRFLALMDDPINVHGTSVEIIKRISDKKLVCRFKHDMSVGFTWARPGEKIGFIENEAMNTFGFGTVESFKALSVTDFELTFREAIPAGTADGDALENLSWIADVTIKNCFFGSNRARGMLLSTSGKVLIENNVFESSGSAILVAGDANGWYESGACSDVIIRNNTFNAPCMTSMYQFCEGIISIFPIVPKPDASKPFHRNIRIESNTFHAFDYPVLYALSTEGLYFNNNTIIRSTQFKPFHTRKEMITLEYCRKVEIKKNKVGDDVLGKNLKLINTPASEVKMDRASGITLIR